MDKEHSMQEGILAYLKKAKSIYTALNVALFVLMGASFVMITQFYLYIGMLIVFGSVLAVSLGLFVAAHIIYNNKIAMGTVFEYIVKGKTITLRTPKKDFTYDLEDGCKSVVKKGGKYVCLFIDASYADTFIFYKRAPLTKNYDTQFSDDDIRVFFPSFSPSREK